MADDIDRANTTASEHLAAAINATRADIPPGVAGDCNKCGEHFERLIGGACGRCRDRYKLP